MALKSIEKQRVTDSVYQQCLDAIRSGEWRPGQRIPSENELTAALGVSRVSVRTALQKLQTLGLVESRQGDGTFVRNPDDTQYARELLPAVVLGQPDLKSFLELRTILDSQMAALAAQRATPEQLRQMEENLARHSTLSSDRQGAAACDLEFHLLIARATGNPLLEQIYLVFQEVFLPSFFDLVSLMGTGPALRCHRRILDAIAAHQPEEAQAAMQEHVQTTLNAAQKPKEDISHGSYAENDPANPGA